MSFIEELVSKFSTFTEDHLMNSLYGVVCLVAGIVLVMFATYFLRRMVFPSLKINRYFAKLMGRTEPLFNLERLMARVFFVVALLAVFSIAAQYAQLDKTVDVFNQIFERLGDIGRLVFNALFPLALALVFAFLAKAGVLWLGTKLNLDQHLGQRLDAGDAVSFGITKGISEIAYGAVFLYFVPEILKGIGLNELSGPITKMFEDVVAFFPRFVVAGVIVFIFWLVAKLIRQVVEGILVSFGVDTVTQKIFGENALGSLKLSKLIPTLIYVIIITSAVIQALQKLKLEKITAPVSALLNSAMQGLPTLVFAIFLVLVAVYFGGLLSKFVSSLLKDIGFDNIYTKLGLSEIKTGAKTPSQIIGFLAAATLVIVMATQALNILGLQNLSAILNTLIFKFWDVMVAVLVFGVGLYVAKNVSSWVEHTTQEQYGKFLSLVVKVVIIVLSGTMALQQIGIADEIVKIAFALGMGSIALGFAIAVGLGSKDVAGEITKDFVSKLRK